MRSELVRKTLKVCSEHCLNVPSTPVRPRPSTISLDSLNGTFSGILSLRPYQISLSRYVRWKAYIFKDNPEINVNQLSGHLVDENIRTVSIPDTEYMTNNTSHSYTSSIVQSHREPRHWLAMLFGKVVPHDRLELLHELGISLGEFGRSVVFDLKFFEAFS